MNGSLLRPLIRAELRAELRAGEVVMTTIPFAASGLLVAAIAIGADTPLLRRVGPGMLWTIVLLFGSFVTLRRTVSGEPTRQEVLTLLGVDPVIQWVARAASSTVLLLGVIAVLVPVTVVIYDPPLTGLAAQAVAAVLVAVGLGALGTLAADLTASTRTRSSLVPLIVTPLTLPLILAAVQVQEGAVYAASPWPWLLLAALADVTIVLAGLLAARTLQEGAV
ncbi:MAG: heme exporter protein CcmB [Actinobacteria bacterium]|nr:heme exporter protein CcmB [Actinomycetota bacterium]